MTNLTLISEPTPEMIAMAERCAHNAWPHDVTPPAPVLSYLTNAALAAIIETQRLDAELADEMRRKHSNPTGDEYTCGQWDQGVRIAAQIRAGKHYRKDEQ